MAKKIKITFLNAYQKKVNRGAERFVEEVAKRLSENFSVSLTSGRLTPKKRWPFLWRVFLDPSGLSILFFSLKNIIYLWRERFDVIIPLNGGWQVLLVRLITWLYGGKMVVVGQSGIGWDDRINLWAFPDIFVGISSKARDWAKKVNPFVRSIYLPNGVDLEKFKPGKDKLPTKLTHPIVLCVGALTLAKRIDLVIKAVAKVNKLSLLVAGYDGEEKEKLLTLGRQLLGSRFQLTQVKLEEMPAIYRTADVFTLASAPTHSFEIALAEALATDLPVVANDDLIRREIVGEVGIFVNPTDSDLYAKALQKALELPRDGQYRRQAEKFDWEVIAKKYEELFLNL